MIKCFSSYGSIQSFNISIHTRLLRSFLRLHRRDLAKVFAKRLDNVLRDIEQIIKSASSGFGLLNFEESFYRNVQNKSPPEFLMTRKAFSIVAMGFTEEKAMCFKEQYIEAFENMTHLIETRIHSKEGYKIMCSSIAKQLGSNGFIFSEEADMINKVILGMTSESFRKFKEL